MFFKKKRNNKESNKNSRIKILGSGCKKCNNLEKQLKSILIENNIDEEIDHITDFKEIAKYNTMKTPAIVIDGVVMNDKYLQNKESLDKLIKDFLI